LLYDVMYAFENIFKNVTSTNRKLNSGLQKKPEKMQHTMHQLRKVSLYDCSHIRILMENKKILGEVVKLTVDENVCGPSG